MKYILFTFYKRYVYISLSYKIVTGIAQIRGWTYFVMQGNDVLKLEEERDLVHERRRGNTRSV